MINFGLHSLYRFGDGVMASTLLQQITTKNTNMNISVRNGIIADTSWLSENKIDMEIEKKIKLLFTIKSRVTIADFLPSKNEEENILIINKLLTYLYYHHEYNINETGVIDTYKLKFEIKNELELQYRQSILNKQNNLRFCVLYYSNLEILKRNSKRTNVLDNVEKEDYESLSDCLTLNEQIDIPSVDYNASFKNKLTKNINIFKVINYQNIHKLKTLLFHTNDDGVLQYIKKIEDTVFSESKKRKANVLVSSTNKKVKL
jgi:gluconate kinase